MSNHKRGGSKRRDNRGISPEKEMINTLIVGLRAKDGMVRQKARRRLVAMGKPAVPFLTKLLQDAREQTRWEAAKALGAIADPEASKALTSAMEDEDFDVRWLAAEALIRLGRDGLPSLLRALAERSNSVWLRDGAHHVLTSLSKKRMKILLKPMLSALAKVDPEIDVPVAARALLNDLKASKGSGRIK
jgi:HEAT repeat protein